MKVAVVGSGISGLVVAWLLNNDHEITVFEADDRIGGHTHTVNVQEGDREVAVDTGFIVFNEAAYPNFCRLLSRLGVESQASDMSFSVSCARSGLEYAGTNLNTIFAQRRNLLRPRFHQMLRDVVRFNRTAPAAARNGRRNHALGAYLESEKYSSQFVEHYIVPMGASIWSADPGSFDQMPLAFFVQFLENHGMLAEFNRPIWRVIRGGSARYVERLTAPFADRIRLRTPVRSVRRFDDRVEIATDACFERFDQIVLACHSDQALRLLADPSQSEREVLSAIRFQRNDTALHTDTGVLPRLRRAWSSWNYHIPQRKSGASKVSYHMNRLQGLESTRDYVVTLNDSDRIDPRQVIRSLAYDHPVFNEAAVSAQARHGEISGVNRTHYCGAYWGYGFHEDGVQSGLAVAKWFGRSLP